jgi:hypothetical protein
MYQKVCAQPWQGMGGGLPHPLKGRNAILDEVQQAAQGPDVNALIQDTL